MAHSEAGMQLYTCAVTIWRTDTDVVTIPVLTVERDRESADRYALAVAVRAISESEPALLERPCRVVSVPQPDTTVAAVLKALAEHRPDLAQHAAVKVKRGRA